MSPVASTSASLAASLEILGPMPDGVSISGLTPLSDDGSTFTGYAQIGAYQTRAFSWSAGEGYRLLEESGVVSLRTAPAVSADGSRIAGNWVNDAYVWSAETGFERLGTLRDEDRSYAAAYGMSADGTVIVGESWGARGTEALRWDPVDGMQGLGHLGEHVFISSAVDVSADGSVIVGNDWEAASCCRSSSYWYTVPFIWDAKNGMRYLTPDAEPGQVIAISGDGSTVIGDRQGDSLMWIWDEKSGLRRIGRSLPGTVENISPRDVSADGALVVGRFSSDLADPGYQTDLAGSAAFVWDRESGAKSLEVLLTALGVDLGGWHLWTASGISADGTTIVGVARGPEGARRPFIAVIPEPSTALLVLAGLVGLAWTRSAPVEQ